MIFNLLAKEIYNVSKSKQEKLAHYCASLGNTTRVAIMNEMVANKNIMKCEILKVNNLSQYTVVINLKGLKKAGLIKGSFNSKDITYQIDYDNLQEFKKLFDDFYTMVTKNKNEVNSLVEKVE